MLLVISFVAGCGGLKQTVVPVTGAAAGGGAVEVGVNKVAIFPFADYSLQQDALCGDQWGGNIKIVEEVTDYFVQRGIRVAVQEDVNTVLVENDIIKPLDGDHPAYGSGGGERYTSRLIGTPEYDLVNVEHSDDMRDEIFNVIKRERVLAQTEQIPAPTPAIQGASVGLSKDMVRELGETLGADLIIRGRIVEYGFKETDTYNPLDRGFLPVLYEPIKDLFFGAPNAKNYESDLDDLDYSQLGEGLAFLLGEKTDDDVVGTWDVLMDNSFGTVANLYPRKKRVSSIVQIRLYAQEAATGDVILSNRVETEYHPVSNLAFNSRHDKTMLDRNVKAGVKLLMDDLFSCISLKAGKGTGATIAGTAGDDDMMKALQDKIDTLEGAGISQEDGKTCITLPEVVLFESGSDALTAEGKQALTSISKVLEEYPNRPINVEGHTDNVPIGPRLINKFASNWELSTARAISVMHYMTEQYNLNRALMSVKGYGPYKPVASNDTAEGKAQNRRVVIAVGQPAVASSK
jgi:flagellar motor protein MotB